MTQIRGIAAFDLNGALLRGATQCKVLARPLGRDQEMERFEGFSEESDIAFARAETARWYSGRAIADSTVHLRDAEWAPGARECVRQLQGEGVEVALVSVTWSFAVRWFAGQLNISHYLGTGLFPSGQIGHVWGRDKARFVRDLPFTSEVPFQCVAAIGDSRGDMEMLNDVGEVRSITDFFVGTSSRMPLESWATKAA